MVKHKNMKKHNYMFENFFATKNKNSKNRKTEKSTSHIVEIKILRIFYIYNCLSVLVSEIFNLKEIVVKFMIRII